MVEDGGGVGDFEREVHVLFDEDYGAAVVGGDAADGVEQCLGHMRCQAHAELVDQEHLGLLDQSPCHREHLLLAAGQRPRG